ncbi:50S ribosomal protein L21 [Candidatus Saccharibacteria bacterium]|nr:MAG: 50S ribosomal protein L21 [Candidatus Saccharibacteria bacterium]
MKAVVRVGGKQYIVSEKETLLVDRLPEGTKELTLDVLMLVDGNDSVVGKPLVTGAKLKAKVIEEEVKGDKVRIIRYKSKKRVHTENGHRQKYSRIEIGKIAK